MILVGQILHIPKKDETLKRKDETLKRMDETLKRKNIIEQSYIFLDQDSKSRHVTIQSINPPSHKCKIENVYIDRVGLSFPDLKELSVVLKCHSCSFRTDTALCWVKDDIPFTVWWDIYITNKK